MALMRHFWGIYCITAVLTVLNLWCNLFSQKASETSTEDRSTGLEGNGQFYKIF